MTSRLQFRPWCLRQSWENPGFSNPNLLMDNSNHWKSYPLSIVKIYRIKRQSSHRKILLAPIAEIIDQALPWDEDSAQVSKQRVTRSCLRMSSLASTPRSEGAKVDNQLYQSQSTTHCYKVQLIEKRSTKENPTSSTQLPLQGGILHQQYTLRANQVSQERMFRLLIWVPLV